MQGGRNGVAGERAARLRRTRGTFTERRRNCACPFASVVIENPKIKNGRDALKTSSFVAAFASVSVSNDEHPCFTTNAVWHAAVVTRRKLTAVDSNCDFMSSARLDRDSTSNGFPSIRPPEACENSTRSPTRSSVPAIVGLISLTTKGFPHRDGDFLVSANPTFHSGVGVLQPITSSSLCQVAKGAQGKRKARFEPREGWLFFSPLATGTLRANPFRPCDKDCHRCYTGSKGFHQTCSQFDDCWTSGRDFHPLSH